MDESTWNDFSQQVKDQTNIVTVISRYIELKSKGNRFWGLCPFHSEKTPSFSVDSDKQFFYCFGCHTGGDAFKFISLIENISYGQAILRQAQSLGINTPSESGDENSPLYEILKHVSTYFHNALTITNYGKEAMEYLRRRGFTDDMIEKFNIGFAPNYWDLLLKSFNRKGYLNDILFQAGLIIQSKKNPNKFYDRFRNRVMIPIYNLHNQVIGYGARSIDQSEPKYLNSPDSSIFNKHKVLYNLNLAAQSIRKNDFAIICEGYMDAIAIASAGIENVVATLGTAFTQDHAKLLSRYTQNLYFCYDSDNPGQIATIRAIQIAQNFNIKVIQIPNAKDPDEFLRSHSTQDFQRLIKSAISSFEFQLDFQIANTPDRSIESRAQILRNLFPIIKNEKPIEQREYIRQIAIKLLIDETTVLRELNLSLNTPQKSIKQLKHSRTGSIISGGRFIIAMILDHPEMIGNVKEFLPEGFEDKLHQEIYQAIQNNTDFEKLSLESSQELALIANLQIHDEIKSYQDSLYLLRIDYLKRRKKTCVNEGQYSDAEKIQKEINELNAEFSR